MKLALTPSMENYLETIYGLGLDGQEVRVKDIAVKMKVRMASVTGALQNLAKHGLIFYLPYKPIRLTERGAELALCIANRHKILTSFLKDTLGVAPAVAEEDACRLEHVLSRETMAGLLNFMVEHHFISDGEKTSIDYWEDKKGSDSK
ncbi:MAG: metal-dependent transcriptional regulator [Sporomusaceae bacterium]|nr:metal-dependent transcriptional regulator [Sporomusaceae bacterium]